MTSNEARSPLVVGITGASGSPYAVRFLERALGDGIDVELVVSEAARRVLRAELDDPSDFEQLAGSQGGMLTIHRNANVGARIASGSNPSRGMVIIPCSTGSLGRIAAGISSSLIERAADVHLKERRPLVLVVRETPLNAVHLENMLRLDRAGATILPAAPGFYGRPRSIADLLEFVVERVFQCLGMRRQEGLRWEGDEA